MQDTVFTEAMERAVALRGGGYIYPRSAEGLKTGHYALNGIGHPYPTYSNEGGEGTCLIGVAIQMLGMKVPHSREIRGADPILKEMGFSPEVAMAGRMAQMHQDDHKTWDEALAVYKHALEIQAETNRVYSAWNIYDLYYEATFRATGIKRENPYKDIMAFPTITVPKATVTFGAYFDEIAEATKKIEAEVAKAVPALSAAAKAVEDFMGSLEAIDVSEKPIEAVVPMPEFAKGGWVSPSEHIYAANSIAVCAPPWFNASVPMYTWTGSVLQKDHALVA